MGDSPALFSLSQRPFGRPRFLLLIIVMLVVEIVLLSPSSVEESGRGPLQVESESLIESGNKNLAPGIPQGRIPEYSVEQFNYVSTQEGVKQWKLLADKANFYHQEKIVHALQVVANLYNPDGTITIITGLEAKYFMDKRDLEVFGTVRTQFPDGFATRSEYLRYLPESRRMEIPVTYAVAGENHEQNNQDIFFESLGLDYAMASSLVFLPKAVHFTMIKGEERTVIDSDFCNIDRSKQVAYFRMEDSRPLKTRFVQLTQPRLRVRARRMDLQYGDFSTLLNYLVAHDDVFIQEENSEENVLRYGTGGRADFDTNRNVIVLKKFPQVYQDRDTVTGEVIIMHRDSDIVEVEQSNAFSEGQ